MPNNLLGRYVTFLVAVVLSVWILYVGKPFLVPVCIAGLLAMLFLPLARKLEKSGFSRALSAFLCLLLMLLIVGSIVFFISYQVSDMVEDFAYFRLQVAESIEKFRSFLISVFGLSRESQDAFIRDRQELARAHGKSILLQAVEYGGIFFVNTILTLIYSFLLLVMRARVKKFIIMVVPEYAKENTEVIIRDASIVGQQYIRGMSLMILTLWLMYGIGFSIIGVKYAVYFAILCGLLELVPFIGNLTGTAITVLMSIAWGADNRLILGILITYGLIQFIQSYFLEPLVVGSGVKLNPLFSIIALVAGEMIWGIPGLILALPLLGILKIIFDHMESLKPYGFLLGRQKDGFGEGKTNKKSLMKRMFN